MSTLSYIRYTFCETITLLLYTLCDTIVAIVSIACGPRQSTTVTAASTRSNIVIIVRFGFRTIVARIGRFKARRILSPTIDKGAVDRYFLSLLFFFLCYMLLHFLIATYGRFCRYSYTFKFNFELIN